MYLWLQNLSYFAIIYLAWNSVERGVRSYARYRKDKCDNTSHLHFFQKFQQVRNDILFLTFLFSCICICYFCPVFSLLFWTCLLIYHFTQLTFLTTWLYNRTLWQIINLSINQYTSTTFKPPMIHFVFHSTSCFSKIIQINYYP